MPAIKCKKNGADGWTFFYFSKISLKILRLLVNRSPNVKVPIGDFEMFGLLKASVGWRYLIDLNVFVLKLRVTFKKLDQHAKCRWR